MTVHIPPLLSLFLSLLLLHGVISSPSERWRPGGGMEGQGQVEESGGVEEMGENWGPLPGEVERLRETVMDLMDYLDHGAQQEEVVEELQQQRHRSELLRNRHQEEEEYEEEEEEEEEEEGGMVVIRVEEEGGEGLTLTSLLFSSPSSWGPCTRSCITRRTRTCKYETLCGDEIKVEEAYCYPDGSTCRGKVLRHLEEEGYVIIEDTEEIMKDEEEEAEGEEEEYIEVVYDDEEEEEEEEDYHQDPDEGRFLLPRLDGRGGGGGEEDEEEDAERRIMALEEEGECGVKFRQGGGNWLRIIGGAESVEGEWPWQVAVLNRFKELFCGGTLVARRWVVTAAHCVRWRLYVRLGEHDLGDTAGDEVEMRVEKSFKHPLYEDSDHIEHDIALLRLPRSAAYSPGVQRACLPAINGPPVTPRTRCIISGWGKERETHIFGTDLLMFAEVPVVTSYTCRKAYPDNPITANHICAGYRKGRYDTCAGDSGGPLVCEREDGRWVLEGVTSFGAGCGDEGKFGVYTRVGSYLEWMKDVMTDLE